MVGRVHYWLCCGLLLSALSATSGCDGAQLMGDLSDDNSGSPGGDNGGSRGDDGSTPDDDSRPGWDDGGIITDCGQRTVGALPGSGYVKTTLSTRVETSPTDSPLLRLLLGSLACPGGFDFEHELPHLHEVAPDGRVLAQIVLFEFQGEKLYSRIDPPVAQRFVVQDGCLVLENGILGESPDIYPTEWPTGPCPSGQASVGPEGPIYGEASGEYICVQAESFSVCHDCWFEDGAWHDETVISVSDVAHGSLDNIVDPCAPSNGLISIRSGERGSITSRVHTTFRVSPSPEDLGYERFELPTWP